LYRNDYPVWKAAYEASRKVNLPLGDAKLVGTRRRNDIHAPLVDVYHGIAQRPRHNDRLLCVNRKEPSVPRSFNGDNEAAVVARIVNDRNGTHRRQCKKKGREIEWPQFHVPLTASFIALTYS
jgi:hypothetical protein